MIKTSAELLSSLNERFKDDTSDDVLTLLEDFTDTLNDFESKLKEDWKTKYIENDKAWRDKYRARFFAGKEENKDDLPEETDNEPDEDKSSTITFDDLFTESEVK